MSDEELLSINGCTVRSTGGETIIDAGYAPSEPEQWDNILTGEDDDDGIKLEGPRVVLSNYSKAANRGVQVPFNWQLTGSCVNGGGQSVATVRAGVEICLLPQAERMAVPFTLFAYGQSRYDAFRDTTQGEGSTGAAMAKALDSCGVLPIDHPGLPKPNICGPAIVYDRAVELAMSSVKTHDPALRAEAKNYNFKWKAVNSSSDAVTELRKGRPLTWAGNWGGRTTPRQTNGILLMDHASVWNHQQACLGFWEHDQLGLIFLILNQWYMKDPSGDMEVEYTRVGRSTYISRIVKPGLARSIHKPQGFEFRFGEPEGSYWILAKDMDYQCSKGEVRSFRNFKGFGGTLTPNAA